MQTTANLNLDDIKLAIAQMVASKYNIQLDPATVWIDVYDEINGWMSVNKLRCIVRIDYNKHGNVKQGN